MIYVDISNDIIKEHSRYILNSDIKNTFLSLKEINISTNQNFIEEHNRFCDFIIKEVEDISLNIHNIAKLEENIFLAKPKILNDILIKIESRYPNISKQINDKDKKYSIDGKEYTYKDIILNARGYEKFSSHEMKDYYHNEKKLINKYSINYIKKRLKDIKSKSKEHYYNKIHFEKVICELISEFESINLLDTVVKDILIELKLKFNEKCSRMNRRQFLSFFEEYINKLKGIQLKYESINIYNYNNYHKKIGSELYEWSAYNFVLKLGIKVCPYCNRQYITPLYSDNGKLRGDLDHFYPKSKYPYLAMSIYNLVPCCKFCNSSLKGDIEFNYENHINPYDINMDDYISFNYIPKSIESFYGKDEVIIKVEDKITNEHKILEKCRKNLEIFKIEDLYQYHSDVIKTLIKKRMIYDDAYINHMYQKYSNIFKDKEDVINTIFKSDIGRDKDSPLSKLIDDILENLKVK